MEGKQITDCSECEYYNGIRPWGYSRKEFFCKHPDKSYISDYYKAQKVRTREGFLKYGQPWSEEIPQKISPAWCPKKKLSS